MTTNLLETKSNSNQRARCESIARQMGDAENRLLTLANNLERLHSEINRAREEVRSARTNAGIAAAGLAISQIFPALRVVKAAASLARALKRGAKLKESAEDAFLLISGVSSAALIVRELQRANRESDSYNAALRRSEQVHTQMKDLQRNLSTLH